MGLSQLKASDSECLCVLCMSLCRSWPALCSTGLQYLLISLSRLS